MFQALICVQKYLSHHHRDGGGKDIFVHISALETSGIKNLSENQKVSYDEARNKDKISAG